MHKTSIERLGSNKGRSGRGLKLEGGRELTLGAVVASETVDTRLDQNQAELGVLVVTVALEVLADGDGLLDEVVQVLRELGSESVGLEDWSEWTREKGRRSRRHESKFT
jgi:hypothetical protein